MDNRRLILSVAGSGKTTHIIESLSTEKRAIIITYTENNYENLRYKVAEKFSSIPDNVLVMTYFEFLYSFCYKPFLHRIVNANGFDFDRPPEFTSRLSRTNMEYYLNSNNCLYHNRLSKLLEVKEVIPKIRNRLTKYFDEFYVDEVQDFGGHDFNLLLELSQIEKKVVFVGDFFQHTFDTSRDGNVNCNLHNDLEKYIKRFSEAGFYIDKETLSKSLRCNRSICEFVEVNLGIPIQSHTDHHIDLALIEEQNEIDSLMKDNSIIKLFLQNSRKYNCNSTNWGASKGQDCHTDVCVVLNPATYTQYKKNKLNEMNIRTRNKFYVACTRARNKLIFVPEKSVKSFKLE